jgi:hypothetical protein
VGQVDEVHHPENERQPGGNQKKQYAELQPIQDLND